MMAASQNYSMSSLKGSYKNEITQVHELAVKHHWPVEFSECREHGPAHRRNFAISVKVGHLSAVGYGCSKKEAKARAAAILLGSLQGIPLPPNAKPAPAEETTDSVISSTKSKPTSCPQTFKEGINPCGCLSEVVQARGIKYPEYSLLESRRLPCGWLFSMRVTVEGAAVVETGPTKKAAKNKAAAKMLELLGVSCPQNNVMLCEEVPQTAQVNFVKEEVQVEVLIPQKEMLDNGIVPNQESQEVCVSPDVLIEKEIFTDSDTDGEVVTETRATSDTSMKKEIDDAPLPPSEVPQVKEVAHVDAGEWAPELDSVSVSEVILEILTVPDQVPHATLIEDEPETSQPLLTKDTIQDCTDLIPETPQVKEEVDVELEELIENEVVSVNSQPPAEETMDSVISSAKSKATSCPQTFKEGINPCGCLSEVVQARGIKYPEYSLLESRRLPCGWLFSIRVTVEGAAVVETGPTKKAAKNKAAAKMLELLGVSCPQNNVMLCEEIPETPQVNFVKEEVQVEVLIPQKEMLDNGIVPNQESQEVCESPDVLIEKEIFTDSDTDGEVVTETRATSDTSMKKEIDDAPLSPSEVPQVKEVAHVDAGEWAPELDSVSVSEVILEILTVPDQVPHATLVEDEPETSQPLLTKDTIQDCTDLIPETPQVKEEVDVELEELVENEVVPVNSQPPLSEEAVVTTVTSVQCELAPALGSVEVLKIPIGPEKRSLVEIEIPETSDGAEKVSEVSSEKLMAPDHPPGSVPHREASAQSNIAEEVFGGEDCPVEDAPVLDSVDEGVLQMTLLDPETSQAQLFSQEYDQSLAKGTAGIEISSDEKCAAQDPIGVETDAPVSTETFSHTEPTSPAPDTDWHPVSCSFIRHVILKLVKRRSLIYEDSLNVVDFLLEKTKRQLVISQDMKICDKDIRAVGNKAAKDLLKDPKLKGRPLRPDDLVFQELMVKHLNNRLNLLHCKQEKKKQGCCLFKAIGSLFRHT